MRTRTPVLLFAVLPMALWGCDGTTPSQLPGRPLGQAIDSLSPAPTRKTTSERIAVLNLDASIDKGRQRLDASVDLPTASELIDQLLLRADLYGTYDDWDEARQISAAVLAAHPNHIDALVLRARVLGTLHEFDEALAMIDRARALQSTGACSSAAQGLEPRALHLEGSVERALDDVSPESVARQRWLAAAFPTYQHTTGLALTLAQLGRYEEADAVFRSALEHYRDVSPFPFAWVAFQRGVMWSEQAGRPDLGRALYREALRYLPGHVLANVHLAEIEAMQGDAQAAIARIEPLVGTTQNPEPMMLLATLEPSADRARGYSERAAAAYRDLLARFPNAFEHHKPDGL